MSDCIFCKIANHQIPCHQVYEDDNFIAFLDITPFTPGHTLLIPKKHFRWVYDVDNSSAYWQVAQKIALAIKNSSLAPEFISFLTMGNQVEHAHIHIIPRSLNDNIQPVMSSLPHTQLFTSDFIDISSQIKNSLK